MSKTRRGATPLDERLRMITEYRNSDLTVSEWCRQHDLSRSTFYMWVKAIRGASDGNSSRSCRDSKTAEKRQDVVALSLFPESVITTESVASAAFTSKTIGSTSRDFSHTIEIEMSGVTVRAANDADPVLLGTVLKALGGTVC